MSRRPGLCPCRLLSVRAALRSLFTYLGCTSFTLNSPISTLSQLVRNRVEEGWSLSLSTFFCSTPPTRIPLFQSGLSYWSLQPLNAASLPRLPRVKNPRYANTARGGATQHSVLSDSTAGLSLCLSQPKLKSCGKVQLSRRLRQATKRSDHIV
jgi:hypothetical protein